MAFIEHTGRLLAVFLGLSLFAGIWQGTVLTAAVGLCLRLFPKTSAAMRFAVWASVLATVALLPLAESVPRGHAAGAGLLHIDPRWSLAIAGLWAAMSLIRGGALLAEAVELWSLRRRALPVHSPSVAPILLGAKRHATLCTSLHMERPGVLGFFRPRILIPAWLFEQLTAPELEQIVLHEMEHLRRRDDWLNLLQKLSLVIFPLNPTLLWIDRRLCVERELACDDGVLRRTHAPRAYAACLTRLAERGLERQALALALGALGTLGSAARGSELGRRVHRILRREAGPRPMQTRVVTATLALGLLGGAVSLARCPQIVSFTPAATVELATAPLQSHSVLLTDAEVRQWRGLPAAHQQTPRVALHAASFDAERSPYRLAVSPLTKHTHRHLKSAPSQHRSPFQAVGNSYLLLNRSARPTLVLASHPSSDASKWTIPLSAEEAASEEGGRNVDRLVILPYAVVPTPNGWLILQL